jgi:hypothetical protein
MSFFKQYLYETILIALVVIVCPVLIYIGLTHAGQAEEGLEEIQRVSTRIRTGKGVSEAQLEHWEQIVKDIKTQTKVLREEKAVRENRENYPLVEVVSGVGENRRGSDIFPWPLGERFRELDARRAMNEAIQGLYENPAFTQAPYVQDIQQEYQKRLDRLKLLNDRKWDLVAPQEEDDDRLIMDLRQWRGDRRSGRPSGVEPKEGTTNVYLTPEGEEVTILSDDEIRDKAAREALFRYALESAKGGMLYVDSRAFDRSRPELVTDFGRDERRSERDFRREGEELMDLPTQEQIQMLWRDQVRLWVFRDVITAIVETNKQHIQRLQKESQVPLEPSVLTAPVKRLMWVDCTGEFFTGTLEEGEERGRYSGRDDDDRRGSEQESDKPKAYTITGDVSNERFDVVRYQVVVVMNPERIPLLERNLSRLNYHAVLGYRAQSAANGLRMPNVSESSSGDRRAGTQVSLVRSDVHYYGAEPVMRVTLDVQLRLVTDWIRGKGVDPLPRIPEQVSDPRQLLFVPEAPPLVPWRILDVEEMEYALREVDRKRIEVRRKMAGIVEREEDDRRD